MKHKHFSHVWLVAVLLCISTTLQAFTPPFSECRAKKDPSQNSYWIFCGKNDALVASVGMGPTQDFDKLKVEIKDGNLVIDTRELFKDGEAGRWVTARFYNPDLSQVVRLEKGKVVAEAINRLVYEMKSEPVGAESHLFFEGAETDENGKETHSWQAENHTGDGSWQEAAIERYFPVGLKRLWGRLDIRKAGVFTIRSVQLKKISQKQQAVDANHNYIWNGGAERGWDSIYNPGLRSKQSSLTGKHIDFRNIEIKSEAEIAIDDKVFHSGKRSFRINVPEDNSNTEFRFNPCPYIPGRPVSYSAWIKAESPNTIVDLGLFLCSGHATGKTFVVGTEWTRCEVKIPAWGENHADCYIIGEMINNPGKEVSVTYPGINTQGRKAKIWVDGVTYSIGEPLAFKDASAVWMRGELDRDNHLYYAGEPVKVNLELEDALQTPVTGELFCEIRDFAGKALRRESLGNFRLEPGKIIAKNLTVSLPPEVRGPLNIVFEFQSSERKDIKAFYLGVTNGKPEKLYKRIGVEISAEQNVKMVIPYLTEFAIGTTRVGSASGDQTRAFELTPFLKDANIEVLFSASCNHEQRDNLTKRAEYFKWLGEMIRKYKGCVSIYETQNEANIDQWSIEQNQEQIKALYETVKANDPAAKLAGPTPCTTDFTWIDNILRNGGAQYLDIVTEHPYRTLPERPDYAADAAAVKKMTELVKPGMPHFGTEAGRIHQALLPGNLINEYARLSAVRDVRNAIQGIAGGAARYYHFSISLWNAGSEWSALFQGSVGNNRTPLPAPILFGFRNFFDRIGDAPVAERVKLGADFRCYIFERGDKRVVVA